MKRRNTECSSSGGKLRRGVRVRSRIGCDSINTSPFIYLKFLLVWALVLIADFILEFRFEYLWPFWLLLRSVYDSFKYQGLAFSVFFVLIALTSDMICFLFIPVHWLFFAASTYVWVQYVWHTERGICLPTVSLWLLFVYIEASVRLRELKNLPFHLDLCRPFAAHCIGYPVVTLGFGFKSYVSYRMRLRKQKEVAKENEFYLELLQKALPQESPPPPAPSLVSESEQNMTEVAVHNHSNHHNSNQTKQQIIISNGNAINGKLMHCEYDHSNSSKKHSNSNHNGIANGIANGIDRHELQYMEHQIIKKISSMNEFDNEDDDNDSNSTVESHNNRNTSNSNSTHLKLSKAINLTASQLTSNSNNNKWNHINCNSSVSSSSCSTTANTGNTSNSSPINSKERKSGATQQRHNNSNSGNSGNANSGSNANTANSNTNTTNSNSNTNTTNNSNTTNNVVTNNLLAIKDDVHIQRLESDIKRLKADLQASRQCELDLRSQLNSIITDDRSVKNELAQLRQDNENLQQRLHNLVSAKQQDKQTIIKLEKNLDEEKKRLKANIDTQLANEKKAKKAEEAAARAAAAYANQSRNECNSDNCKAKRRELDNDLKQIQHEIKLKDEQLKQSEKALRQYKNSHDDTEVLMSALSAMQDKNAHLEKSLSAETRLKLDLFSALDETKRQFDMTQLMLMQREKEIDELKSKIAEVMAVMPSTLNGNFANITDNVSLVNSLLPVFGNHSKYLQDEHNHHNHNIKMSNSSPLDPNASIYMPKVVSHDL